MAKNRSRRSSKEKKEKTPKILKLSDALELPSDSLTSLFKLELIGSRELTIENIRGILEYSDEIVSIAAQKHVIMIFGSSLEIKSLSSSGIFIGGKIGRIEFMEA